MRWLPRVMLWGLVAAGCEENRPPPNNARTTVASVRRHSPSTSRHGGGQGNVAASPPPVDSARACPEATFATLARLRRGRTLHMNPVCTDVYNGRFSAVFATGSAEEATDVWVVFHDTAGDEVHRVGRWPAGARIEFGRITQGWVYLRGRSNALDEMPAGAKLLAIFPLPRPRGEAPEVRLLSPLEADLLRADDLADLERRLTFPVPAEDPSASTAEEVVRAISQRGPDALLDHLTPEGAPTLRAWQVGLFQETDYVSPQGDPTSPHVANALTLIRSIAPSMDCTAGDRCVARPQEALAPGAAPPQIMLRRDGTRVVLAALIAPVPPRIAQPDGRVRAWGDEVVDDADARALAERLTLDGNVGPHVVSSTMGDVRALAFQVTRATGGAQTRVYTVRGDRAARAYLDASLGQGVEGDVELHLRDYERDGGFELVSIASVNGAPTASVASLDAPSTATQHQLTHRLDMLRVAYGAATVRDVDGHLARYRPAAADPNEVCPLLERIRNADARSFASATGGQVMSIPYRESGQPLRGEPRRLTRRELRDDNAVREVLGPFAGKVCAELSCDWSQSVCHLEGASEGVLWFADNGRRIAAVSLRR